MQDSSTTDPGMEYLKAIRASKVVPEMPFEQYAEMYKDSFIVTRKNGICEIRMHSDNGPSVFGPGHHHGWSQLLTLAGKDPENEVIIISGTGDMFVKPVPDEVLSLLSMNEPDPASTYSRYLEGTAMMSNLINDINVPTIGVVNGHAGALSSLATLCDITICSDNAVFEDAHFALNIVSADGVWQAYQHLIGTKRACYASYMNKHIDAQTALEWGLVNEVVPLEQVHDRAWEIAEVIMKSNKYVRRLTHDMFKGYYKEVLDKMPGQFSAEMWASLLTMSGAGKSGGNE